MKISKKILALLIAVIMVITSFGQSFTTIAYADEISEYIEFSNSIFLKHII